MNKLAVIIICCIALTAHAAGTMLVERLEIIVYDFLRRLLPALRHGERHDIPYHKAYGFVRSVPSLVCTAGMSRATAVCEMLHLFDKQYYRMMSGE